MTPTFCPHCREPLIQGIPQGDNFRRAMCASCGWVHYDSPRVVVACLATWDDKLLWIRRATEPRKGYWANPSGFAESGETPEQAAARELREETGAIVSPDDLRLFLVGALPQMNQIYLVYRGKLERPEFHITDEADRVALFARDEAPWDEYAYPVVSAATRQFYADHERGEYGVYSGCYVNGQHTFVQSCQGYNPSLHNIPEH